MTWLLFLIFLVYAGYQKYTAAPPSGLDQPYLMGAALVLAATVVVPFFISYVLTRATQLSGRTPAIMIAFISSVALSVLGYGLVWQYFGGVGDMRIPLEQALRLGLTPGLVMGAILAADSLFRRHG